MNSLSFDVSLEINMIFKQIELWYKHVNIVCFIEFDNLPLWILAIGRIVLYALNINPS